MLMAKVFFDIILQVFMYLPKMILENSNKLEKLINNSLFALCRFKITLSM